MSIFPRLSEARTFLPFLRAQLTAAAARYTLPADIVFELLPIVEDGVFGYELVPDKETHTYLTIGRRTTGEAVLRRTVYCDGTPSALRLAALDGKSVEGEKVVLPRRTRQRDAQFAEICDAVEAGFGHLIVTYAGRPRKPVELRADVHRYLDEALSTAHEHLVDWNPHIVFCGIPNEAQLGYTLMGDHGERGELVSQRPDMWVLRWNSAARNVYEEWAVSLPPAVTTSGSGAA